MIKSCKRGISPVLVHLYNLSITTKCFPDSWKITKVRPLYKGGNAADCNNYRPISIIPTLGKILERIIHKQCSNYLEMNNVLSAAQSGFRKGRSTGTCLVEFLDNIYREIDRGRACGVLFLDLAKAFDTVSHEILLLKLKNVGFKENCCSWFRSYLRERSQVTMVDDVLSSELYIECGVPQGSILGPLLFIVYINDIARNCIDTVPFIYADDTALVTFGSTKEELESKLQQDLVHIGRWFSKNKLSLNISKTKAMLLCGNGSKLKHESLELKLNDVEIECVHDMKYLGVIIDRHLTFTSHINKLCGKISAKTGLLWRVRSFIDNNLAMKLYNSLIYPHFLYCNFILDGCSKTNRNKLQIQQNNALRAVLRADYDIPTAKLHTDAGVDTVETCMKKTTCKIVYRGIHNLGPPIYDTLFNLAIPNRDLRSSDIPNAEILTCRTRFGEHNVAYRGPTYYNQLPITLRMSQSMDQFKNTVNKYDGFG